MISIGPSLTLQLAMLSKSWCNRCKPKKVAGQVVKTTCKTIQSTCNLSYNAVVTQVAMQGKLDRVALVLHSIILNCIKH